MTYDLIVVGSGLAGLYGSLLAARRGRVLLLSKSELADCNTFHAQGGIAAALLPPDTPALHYRDTLVAGAALSEPRAVRALVEEGPARVRDLIRLGVPFDRHDGALDFTREGAHSANRVLHAGGDASGARIETTMVERVSASSNVDLREHCLLLDLLLRSGRVVGARVLDEENGEIREYFGNAVLLATGGAGQLFAHTTNPTVATGDGIAVAFRAGAALADLEFVQFHPTALFKEGAPRFLISEAVRGEGGVLRNAAGEAFMTSYDPRGDLAPRDVVSRGILFEAQRTGGDRAYLDVTHLGAAHFRARFPTIARVCAEHGIDFGHEPIPVAPAAHYLMGGILTDEHGATTLPGLYASGECACSGVHGANRLASNSLLETIVFSARAVEQHFGVGSLDQPTIEILSEDELLPPLEITVPALTCSGIGTLDDAADTRAAASDRVARYHGLAKTTPDVVSNRARRGPKTWSDATEDSSRVQQLPPSGASSPLDREELRERTWRQAGLIRDAAGLSDLVEVALASLRAAPVEDSRAAFERANLALLTHLAARAALRREESRGGHYRSDAPQSDPSWRLHLILRNAAAPENWLAEAGRRPALARTGRSTSSGRT